MNELIKMLEDFLSNQISPSEFSRSYLQLYREIGNEQKLAIESNPDWNKRYHELRYAVTNEEYDSDKFSREWNALWSEISNIRVNPLSELQTVVSELFTITDMYDDHTIDETELRLRIKEQLEKIRKLS